MPANENYYGVNGGGAVAMEEWNCDDSPTSRISNSLFDHNVVDPSLHASAWGGALWFCRDYCPSSFVVSNCTFVNNRSQFGSAIGAKGNYGTLTIERNIFVNDTGAFAIGDTVAAPAPGRKTELFGNLFDESIPPLGGQLGCDNLDNSNSFEDPRFCDPGNGDYRLCERSPALAGQSACGQLIGAYGQNCICGVAAGSNQLSPMPGQYVGEPGVDLKWNPVAGAAYYQLQVGEKEAFCSSTLTDTTSRAKYHLERAFFAPDPGFSFWRVRARTAGSWSRWSPTMSFKGGSEPSCPVLFSYDGTQYLKENPLLTACERTNYRETVTDYYLLKNPPRELDGVVRLQLKEMEDETTFLEAFYLMVVDHPKAYKISVTAAGAVQFYQSVASPVAAVDQDGIDRLGEVLNQDGRLFTASQAGYLVVTFPSQPPRNVTLLHVTPGVKLPCGGPIRLAHSNPGGGGATGVVKVELLDRDGSWSQASILPSRQWPEQEVVAFDSLPAGSAGKTTIKISWDGQYSTDQVCQIIPEKLTRSFAGAAPVNATLIKTASLASANQPRRSSIPVTLSKGDNLELTFAVPRSVGPDSVRDYIVCATGRYSPRLADAELTPNRSFRLSGNYPNPFNASTNISYELDRPAHVRLTIYNIAGQVVRTLLDVDESSGDKTVAWEGRDDAGHSVASGVYLYRMEVAGMVDSKKMVLLK